MNDIRKFSKLLLSDTICRICLEPCSDMISIFKNIVLEECHISLKTTRTISVVQVLENITEIKVYDQFSNMVCKTCVHRAIDAFTFKNTLRTTESWIQSNISKFKIKTQGNNMYKIIESASNEVGLDNENNLQTIKTWLESVASKFEIDNSKKNPDHLNCQDSVISKLEIDSSKKKKFDLQCQGLQDTSEFNLKYIIIAKNKNKAEVVLQPHVPKLQKLSEQNLNSQMIENHTPINTNVGATEKLNDSNLQVQWSNEMINSKMSKSIRIKNRTSEENPHSVTKLQIKSSQENSESNKDKLENKTYENLIELSAGLKDHDYNIIFCDICAKPFPAKCAYKEHKCNNTKEHKCQYCVKSFTTFELLKNHELAHCILDVNYPIYINSKCEKFYLCKLCPEVYKRFGTLSEHLSKIHASKDERYCCCICTERFKELLDLQNHIQSHTEGSRYFCVHCDKKYTQITDLNIHVKTHSLNAALVSIPYDPTPRKNAEPRNIAFLDCSKEKIYCCPHCKQKYAQQIEYKAHLKHHSIHDKVVCGICGNSYRRYQLNSHIRSHKKSVFRTKSNLKRHTKRTPYTCEECGKQFDEKDYLRLHMKYHNKDQET